MYSYEHAQNMYNLKLCTAYYRFHVNVMEAGKLVQTSIMLKINISCLIAETKKEDSGKRYLLPLL